MLVTQGEDLGERGKEEGGRERWREEGGEERGREVVQHKCTVKQHCSEAGIRQELRRSHVPVAARPMEKLALHKRHLGTHLPRVAHSVRLRVQPTHSIHPAKNHIT